MSARAVKRCFHRHAASSSSEPPPLRAPAPSATDKILKELQCLNERLASANETLALLTGIMCVHTVISALKKK
jgi:hypothetical protein